MSVTSGGYNVPGSPFKIVVASSEQKKPMSENVIAVGSGLSMAAVNKSTEFIVDGSGAGPGLLRKDSRQGPILATSSFVCPSSCIIH